MKIIAVGMNYAAHNKELHHTLELTEPTIFMKSDSSLLKDGKPFFIPDFSSEIHYETELVVKIDRLGKILPSVLRIGTIVKSLSVSILQPGICNVVCVSKACLGKSARHSITRPLSEPSFRWKKQETSISCRSIWI